MMWTKRFAALAVALLALAVGISACGGGGSSSNSSEPAESTEASEPAEATESSEDGGSASIAQFEERVKEKEKPVTEWPEGAPTEPVKKVEPGKLIVDIALSPEEPSSLTTAEGVVEAAEAIGWKGKILYSEYSSAGTNAAFEQAITLGADAVVTQGIEPKLYKSAISKLHDSGAILVTTYSEFPPSEEFAQAEVSQPSAEMGELAAAAGIVESDGKGQFANFGFPQFEAVKVTTEGFQSEIENCAECEVLSPTNTNAAEAEKTLPTATSTILQQNPELFGIYNPLDTFLDGFQLPVLRQQGGEVKAYANLCGKPTLEAIEKEEVSDCVTFPLSWGGWTAIDTIARLFAGQKTYGEGVLATRIVNSSNVKEVSEHLGPTNFWDADGFDYRGEYEKLWGV
jgi:ABC-type sugar transport system substrate-binding protein